MHAAPQKATILLMSLSVALACSEPLKVPPRPLPTSNFATISAAGCGASYTLITYDADTVMAQYGIPPVQDTISVCETWTGSDYTLSAKTVGSSELAVMIPDTIQQATYADGSVGGFDAAGATLDAAGAVGPDASGAATVFSFMNADSGSILASYDSPYYAIAAPPADVSIEPNLSSHLGTGALDASAGAYTRHGLARRGVRALVDGMDEIGRSPTGNRRFKRMTQNGDVVTLEVDAKTELLVGEETQSPEGKSSRATHRWAQTNDGWVRTQTDLDEKDSGTGIVQTTHTTVKYRDVRLGGVLQSPLAGGAQ